MGAQISYNGFPNTFQNYSFTFYKESQYYYIRAESFGLRAEVPSAFLADWHGTLRLSRWLGAFSGWDEVYSTYMQDTNARKTAYCKINADGLSLSAAAHMSISDETHNLWRVFFAHDQWGSTNGLNVTFYIGNCRTMGQSNYDNNVKGTKIYSNGTIGQSYCGILASGSSSKTSTEVLSYFTSNKGTRIDEGYSRYAVGALRI